MTWNEVVAWCYQQPVSASVGNGDERTADASANGRRSAEFSGSADWQRICCTRKAADADWRVSFSFDFLVENFIFTALHVMQTRYCYENSVCLSVGLSVCPSVTRVYCDKTEERSVQIYIPYERTFSPVFWEEKWSVGRRPLLPEILGQPTPIGAKSPIFNQ